MIDPLDDDVIPDLTPLGPIGEDEAVGVDDDGDDPVAGIEGEDEHVGLDDVTGRDEPIGDEDLLLDIAHEGERWTAGSDEAGDLAGDAAASLDAGGAEYGWTADTEAPTEEEWPDDVLAIAGGHDESFIGDDHGEEGADEDFSVRVGEDDDAPTGLPRLDMGTSDQGDELADDLDLQDEGEVEGADLSYDEEARLSGATVPALFDGGQLAVTHLGPGDDAIVGMSVVGEDVWAAGDRLYRSRGGALVLVEGEGLEGLDLTSVAVLADDGSVCAVGTRLAGVLLSVDDGRSFERVNSWLGPSPAATATVPFHVHAARHAGAPRTLWGRTRSGALFRSEDRGVRWSRPVLPSPVAALALAPSGVFALCVPGPGRCQLVRSADDGRSWTTCGEPPLAVVEPGTAHMGVVDEVVVVVEETDREGPVVSSDGGASFSRLADLPGAGPVALVLEAARPVLYAGLFFEGADRGVVVRRALAGAPSLVLDVLAERRARGIEARADAEGENRVLSIDATVRDGGTRLHVATGAGLFRVELRIGEAT